MCPEVDENLVSVLYCLTNDKAVIFIDNHTYIVSNAELVKLRKNVVRIAHVLNGEYILKLKPAFPPIVSLPKAMLGHGSAPTLTSTQSNNPSRMVLRMRNPLSQGWQPVTLSLPPRRKRGLPGKQPVPEHPPPQNPSCLLLPRTFFPLDEKLQPAIQPCISPLAAQLHQIMSHAPTLFLMEMALNPNQ